MKKKLILALLILRSLCFAQDIIKNVQSNGFALTVDRPWSDANHVWIFRPKEPKISLYIFVINKNTTNAHPLTVNVYQTPATDVADFTNNQGFWIQDSINNGSNCNNVPAYSSSAVGATKGCWVNTMFASQIAVVITGAGTLAGAPDNFSLYVTQDTGEPKGEASGTSGTISRTTPFFTGYTTDYDSGLVLVPTALTSLTATTTAITDLQCSNITGAAATVTITNTAGTVFYANTFSVPANSILQLIRASKGFPSVGIKWQAGTVSAINCQVTGYQ